MRSAAADLAVRVHLSEQQIRSRAHRADVLTTRCPLTWAAYLNGDIAEQNATTAAQLADTLPADDRVAWTVFDATIVDGGGPAGSGEVSDACPAARERAHPESVEERHGRAMTDRGVWFTPELDGMASINALLPAADAHAIESRVDETARHLVSQDGEDRTLAQVRADVLVDLLLSGGGCVRSGARRGDRAHHDPCPDPARPVG